jgi:hypothetical protein
MFPLALFVVLAEETDFYIFYCSLPNNCAVLHCNYMFSVSGQTGYITTLCMDKKR